MIGVIFDCDGTLVDSEKAHFLSWKDSIRKRGLDLSEEEYYFLAGQTGAYISQKFYEKFPIDSPEAIHCDKKKVYRQLVQEGVPPIERTVKFVHQLALKKKECRIQLGVASAAPKDEILTHLQRLGLSSLFDAVVSGVEDLAGYCDPEGVNKPKPYIYLHAAKLLGIEPSKCAAVEDTNTGVLAATRAGMTTFAAPNAFTKYQDFSQADYLIAPDVEFDLDDFIGKIRNHV